MNKSEVLKKSELFRHLDGEQLSLVEGLCTAEVFEPGDIVTKQDRKEERVYVIEEGLVAIILEAGPLSQRQVQAACNFEIVGWSSMIEPFISTATVKAVEKTKVFTFNGMELYNLCKTHPEIGCIISQGIARVVATRLRNAYTQLLGVTSQA